MPLIPQRLAERLSTWLVLFGLSVVVVLAAIILFFALRDDEGAAAFPAARLVPEDAAFYLRMNAEAGAVDSLPADAIALLWDPILRGAGIDPDEAIARPLTSVALFSSNFEDPGAFIFGVRDAAGVGAVTSLLRDRGLDQRAHGGVSYGVTADGHAFAVVGDHLVSAIDEPTLHASIDAWRGERDSLAESADFRRLRDAFEGDAPMFLYLDPGSLFAAGGLMGAGADEAAGAELTALLSLIIGGEGLFTRPMGARLHADGNAFRMEAAMLGDPGPLVRILRPRDSRFAHMVPAGTPMFLSTYDLAGVLDAMFGENDLAARLRDSVLESLDDGGALARLEDALSLFEGEVAFAQLPPQDGEAGAFVLLAEVDDEDRAREVLEGLFREPLAAGDAALWVGEGAAIVATNAAAIETVRAAASPGLAASLRYIATVDLVKAPLATFVYIDAIPWLLQSMPAVLSGIEDIGDVGGFILNVFWKDDRLQVEAAIARDPAD